MVIGARGMLGNDLVGSLNTCKDLSPVISRDLPELDITNPDALRASLAEHQPAVVFNCAAYTDVDGCEDDPERGRAVNALAPGALGRAAREVGALLVHISTDFVFDGDTDRPYTEDDPPNPLSVYGQTKLGGERAVIESGCKYLICRTAWLYGKYGKNFVNTIRDRAHTQSSLSVVSDQFGSPTWTKDLADMLLQLVRKDARGIVHTVNAGRASWCELAREAVRLSGLTAEIKAISAKQYPRKARPPKRSSVLDTTRFFRLAGQAPEHWKSALARYLGTLELPADAVGS